MRCQNSRTSEPLSRNSVYPCLPSAPTASNPFLFLKLGKKREEPSRVCKMLTVTSALYWLPLIKSLLFFMVKKSENIYCTMSRPTSAGMRQCPPRVGRVHQQKFTQELALLGPTPHLPWVNSFMHVRRAICAQVYLSINRMSFAIGSSCVDQSAFFTSVPTTWTVAEDVPSIKSLKCQKFCWATSVFLHSALVGCGRRLGISLQSCLYLNEQLPPWRLLTTVFWTLEGGREFMRACNEWGSYGEVNIREWPGISC